MKQKQQKIKINKGNDIKGFIAYGHGRIKTETNGKDGRKECPNGFLHMMSCLNLKPKFQNAKYKTEIR